MSTAIIYANLVMALVSAAFGIIAMIRPMAINPAANGNTDERFFILMYAARTIPFGLIAGILPLFFGGWAIATLLIAGSAHSTRRCRHRHHTPHQRYGNRRRCGGDRPPSLRFRCHLTGV